MEGDILNIFNEKCDKRYAEMGLCHSYFFKEFNAYPSVLNIKQEYLDKISKFHDPILTYVSIYLYRNYEIAQEYFITKTNGSQKVNSYNNAACGVLNRWLDQEKNFYTNFGRCYYNLRWWNISIEPLWKELKKYYPNKTCERYDSYYYKKISLKNPYNKNDKCYNQEVEDHVCFKKDDTEFSNEICDKLSILFYLGEKYKLLNNNSVTAPSTTNNYCSTQGNSQKINYNPVLKAEKSHFCQSLTSNITLPIIVTVLGTIFLAFFLNEFTPIGSKLRTPYKNKVRLRDQFNEEAAYEEYESYRHNSQNTDREKNIIYYQSMNE